MRKNFPAQIQPDGIKCFFIAKLLPHKTFTATLIIFAYRDKIIKF